MLLKFVMAFLGLCGISYGAAPDYWNEDSTTQRFLSRTGVHDFRVHLQDDLKGMDFPASWRSWWYVKLNKVDRFRPTKITITGRARGSYYLPVYSYDGVNWTSFGTLDVTKRTSGSLVLRKIFEQPEVLVARSQPYSFMRLKNYLSKIENNPFVKIDWIGTTPDRHPYPLLTVTNRAFPAKRQMRVWVHARAHPGETATSYLVEGLIDYLTKTYAGQRALKFFVFNIAPMHNIDGVVRGFNRTNSLGVNLEEQWHLDRDNIGGISLKSPQENRLVAQLLHRYQRSNLPVVVSLNLHSTARLPSVQPHFIGHFGESRKYTRKQVASFRMQKVFVEGWQRFAHFPKYKPFYSHVGAGFLDKAYLETWMWRRYQHKVLAMTFEATYGYVPGTKRFFTANDHRWLGKTLGQSVITYFHRSNKSQRKALLGR